jgi:hypothetical protein
VIFDMRTYVCRPGTIAAHLKLYEEFGKAPQTKHLGQPVFYAVTETGLVNSFVHIWAYDDAADRAKKRAAMQADPDWQTYMKKSAELGALVQQNNQIMNEVPFFKVKR